MENVNIVEFAVAVGPFLEYTKRIRFVRCKGGEKNVYFPKKITLGENCIIHLKFVNHEKNNEVIKYILKVMDPNGKTILNINRNMILGGSSENNFVRELYYNVEIGNHFLPGKYIVDFYLYCKGIKVESITKDIDYFNVEKLSYFTDGKYTYIVNESIEETEFLCF